MSIESKREADYERRLGERAEMLDRAADRIAELEAQFASVRELYTNRIAIGKERAMAILQLEAQLANHPDTAAWITQFCIEKGKWSIETFGPTDELTGPNYQTITDHIRKELAEIAENPFDLMEWIDVIFLGVDGYFRYDGRELEADLRRKHEINLTRRWPDPTKRKPGSCTEHIRDAAIAAIPEEATKGVE